MVHLKPAYLSRETKYDFFSCFCSDGCLLSLCYQNKLLVSSLLYLYTIFHENLLPKVMIKNRIYYFEVCHEKNIY
jgi:hypothetical protein